MRLWNAWVLTAFAATTATPAFAGPYSDDFTKCLVSKATPSDHETLVKWMFSALAAGPAVKELAKVTPEQRTGITAAAGNMFTRLITQACREQMVAALKYEGNSAIETGFATLGNVAARDLMTDPAVQAEMSNLEKVMDKTQFDSINKEAGVPTKN